MRLSYSQDDDSMTMCLSNSQDDDSMTMCLSYSQEDDSMTMCLSYSQDDDSMTMCLSYSPDEESRKPERTVPSLQLYPSQTKILEGRTTISERIFEALFKDVSTGFGRQNVEKCFENAY